MEELKEKPQSLINNNIMNIVHHYSVQSKVKLMGSNRFRGLLYGSDLDIESKITGRAETLYNHFKKVFNKPMKNVYIMDFKAGYDSRLVYDEDTMDLKTYLENPLIPKLNKQQILKSTGKEQEDLIRDLFILRWTPADIKKGKIKLIDGTYKSFVSCLTDDTKIKVDLIVGAGSGFVEISELYIYKQTPLSKEEVLHDLEEDIKYYKSFNTLKATKRFFSMLRLENKNKTLQTKLIKLFNSEVGLINKIMNDLTLLLDVDEKYGLTYEQIENGTQIFKERLGRIPYLAESKILLLNKITKKNYKKNINELLGYLLLILNKITKKYLNEIGFKI